MVAEGITLDAKAGGHRAGRSHAQPPPFGWHTYMLLDAVCRNLTAGDPGYTPAGISRCLFVVSIRI